VIVQGAKSVQIVVQVVGGDTVKAIDPLFEATVVAVDVLNMVRTIDTDAIAQVDGIMSNICILGKVVISQIAIAYH